MTKKEVSSIAKDVRKEVGSDLVRRSTYKGNICICANLQRSGAFLTMYKWANDNGWKYSYTEDEAKKKDAELNARYDKIVSIFNLLAKAHNGRVVIEDNSRADMVSWHDRTIRVIFN